MSLPEQMSQLVSAWVTTGDEAKEQPILDLLDTPEYRALPYAQRNKAFITSSKLKELQKCPYHARLRYEDGVEMGYEEPDYFLIGQAVDDYLTHGPKAFTDKYEVVARRSKDAEKFQLTNATAATVNNAATEYLSRDFFPKQPQKRNVIWLLHGMPCKAELDHFDPETRRIGEIKTCASITTFEPESYSLQMGFYSYGIAKKWDERVEAELYVLDKHSDWSRSHKWIFSAATLQAQHYQVEQLVQQWKDCEETGIWPHVPTDTDQGLRACWSSEFWSVCPFCKTASPTVL